MRRCFILLTACAAMIGVSALSLQNRPPLLVISWAGKAPQDSPTVAVLIEMGVKDSRPRDWSGRVRVHGATVVRREGYRFRATDKLLDGGGWTASSHRAIRAPKGIPQISKMEPIATVGVILHLKDVKEDAQLALEFENKDMEKAEIPLKNVLAGKTQSIWRKDEAWKEKRTSRVAAGFVRQITAAVPVEIGRTEDDFPAAAYGPDGTLWVAYISYTVKEDSRRIEAPMLKQQPKNFKKYYTPEYGDQLFVKYYRAGTWSAPIAVTPPMQDLARCAIAVDKDRKVRVVYSAHREANFDVYQRTVIDQPDVVPELAAEIPLTRQTPGMHITPVACTDQDGRVWVACQSWGPDGQARITVLLLGKGAPARALIEGANGENCWHPAIAADNTGKVAIAYDIYHDGSDYDVRVAVFDGGIEKRRDSKVAAGPKAEMRPSVAYQGNRLWIAYEEGPEKWGQDSGALVRNKGEPLYSRRSVRVVSLGSDGRLSRPVAELPLSTVKNASAQFSAPIVQNFERAVRYAYPKLGVDLQGRLWLAYRQSSSSRYSSHPGSYWLTYLRCLGEKSWSEPIEVDRADGLLDHRPVLLPHRSGGLLIVHNTDGRYSTPETIDNQIYAGLINLPSPVGEKGRREVAEPQLVAHAVSPQGATSESAAQRAAVKRIRDYRIKNDGREYRILRGEFHRHTEISWDGGADGSLEDMFRYAIDAAAMDWIGNGDHDNGAGREYSWWLIQKFTDAYHVPQAFTPMFSYERSVSYPHGHRNCMFARRGIRTLPRLAPPAGKNKAVAGVHPDDTKMLYRYLKEFDGICAGHTGATGMGTDWRDNDPSVEPIVEIYQGDRNSYEMKDAPRAGHDPKRDPAHASLGGWQPKGFVNLALKKGYRLGFQSSSDHWSTHISYFMVLAEKHDRAGILAAIKKRHTYGATDNIIMDVRSGRYLQGDEFKTNAAPTLEIHVIGTGDLGKIDILRDSDVVATIEPHGPTCKCTWADPQPAPGMHYYYVRAMQRDGELAWASPLWIDYAK
jgi:hypothetical protein